MAATTAGTLLGPHARKPELRALTGLRAVAAIGVVLSHTKLPKSVPEHLAKIPQWGYIGVPLFFMLSGLVLAYNYPELNFRQGRRTVKFYIARVARVMPLYWAVIAYCAGYYYLVGREQYEWPLVQNILAIQTWSGDLKTAQGYYNAPGWSIGVELVFYLLFPFAIPVVAGIARKYGARGLIALLAAMTLVVLALWVYFNVTGRAALPPADPGSGHRWLYRNPLSYLPHFLSGMAAAFLIPYVQHWNLRLHHVLQASVVGYVLGLAMFRGIGPAWTTASWGLFFIVPFTVMLLTLACDRGWLARLLGTGPMIRLGLASYALYITHRWLIDQLPTSRPITRSHDLIPYVALAITVFMLVLIAEGAHQYIELPCRRWIVQLTAPLTRPRPAPRTPTDPGATMKIPLARHRKDTTANRSAP